MATNPAFILGIDGRSGAGKSTLAVELATELRRHRDVAIFHLEDIYPGWDGLAAGSAAYVSDVLAPLRRGEHATWDTWDWVKSIPGTEATLPPAPVIIIEGVGAGCAAARDMLDALIWVEVPDDTRKSRALDRDGEVFAAHWDRWAAQEDAYLSMDQVPQQADIVVNNRADGSAAPHALRALSALPNAYRFLALERAVASAQLPVHQQIQGSPDTAALFEALYKDSHYAVLLESSNLAFSDPRQRNRFSIMGAANTESSAIFEHTGGQGILREGTATARIPGGFFEFLAQQWDTGAFLPDTLELPFVPGWLGYLGYELKRETGGRNIVPTASAGGSIADAALIRPAQVIILDHQVGMVHLLCAADGDPKAFSSQVQQVLAQLPAAVELPRPLLPAPIFESHDDQHGYLAKVRAAQEQIRQGYSYEVCLTTSLRAQNISCEPWQNYVRLRAANPAPFAHYLRFGNMAAASTSPERFMSIAANGWMRAEPIKGTRPRGKSAAEDAALIQELESSAKDRAENIMIVDLLRNDLSRFADPATLSVPRLCAIESYATVHQMVSTIDARLLPGASRAEAIAAAFPAGSMTGAPKISTMRILDELEDGRTRGLYSGAVGYFSATGATDLSVVIRTLVMSHAKETDTWDLSLGVGGAITADSSPQEEWDEVRTKAFGVLSALGSVFPA
ncbi:chorismate-binding protein [Arthrobacter sp. MYb227]|uniref:chorismate-binding protein n=1 Tax=Arthrobacter sp. MYb227 TaxID=1848601 RepID=UPI0015E41906|nr:chorismate-binding protein [Arthrobacter sp. MYb227]